MMLTAGMWCRVLLMAALGACACANAGEIPPAAAADLILFNGRIITVDSDDSVVEALAIKNHRILAVGSDEDIQALAGRNTRRIDLQGFAATPGLLDAHAHFARGGTYLLNALDLSYPDVRNVDHIVRLVAEQAKKVEAGAWIEGRGWDEGKLADRRYVYAKDLDPVTPEHPVYLSHTMGHYGVANGVAMKMANITRDTPDPPGGTIDRDAHGEPTGVLKETAQMMVRRLIPPVDAGRLRQGIRHMAASFNREGMTGLKDPGIDRAVWDAYQSVLDEGRLTVRVFALWRVGDTVEQARDLLERIAPFTRPYISPGDGHLVSGGVKLLIDGSGGARTAWLYDDWNKDFEGQDVGNRGYPVHDLDVLGQQIRMFHDAGIHIGVHAIGDRAIDWLVDHYVTILRENPVHGLRHSVIHANIPTDHALQAMSGLQARFDAGYPEPSATFMWWIGDTYAGNFGPQRSLRLNPFRTYLERGIRWAGGSDYGVTPFPARFGLWASIARETLLGTYGRHPYGTEQSIDIREALRSYTLWSARQIFLEDAIGSLEPGKLADIAVWDRDPYTVATGQIKEMQCVMTLFDGEIVYHAADGPRILTD
jgi:predicted amidohydrolase YtcJ